MRDIDWCRVARALLSVWVATFRPGAARHSSGNSAPEGV